MIEGTLKSIACENAKPVLNFQFPRILTDQTNTPIPVRKIVNPIDLLGPLFDHLIADHAPGWHNIPLGREGKQ